MLKHIFFKNCKSTVVICWLPLHYFFCNIPFPFRDCFGIRSTTPEFFRYVRFYRLWNVCALKRNNVIRYPFVCNPDVFFHNPFRNRVRIGNITKISFWPMTRFTHSVHDRLHDSLLPPPRRVAHFQFQIQILGVSVCTRLVHKIPVVIKLPSNDQYY